MKWEPARHESTFEEKKKTNHPDFFGTSRFKLMNPNVIDAQRHFFEAAPSLVRQSIKLKLRTRQTISFQVKRISMTCV